MKHKNNKQIKFEKIFKTPLSEHHLNFGNFRNKINFGNISKITLKVN